MLWLLIGTLLLPLLSLTSAELSLLIAHAFIISTAIGIPITWIAHVLFPDPDGTPETKKEAAPKSEKKTTAKPAAKKTASKPAKDDEAKPEK